MQAAGVVRRPRMRMRVALAGALLLGLPLGATAAEPRALLERMERALHELDYTGTLVYSERGRMEAIRVFHDGGSDRQRERLLSLTGPAREVVRENGRVTCIGTAGAPRTWGGAELPPLPALDDATAEGALEHYELALGDPGRIAGRDALQVEIRARDAFRYSYRLWIDEDSGLLLKSMRHGADGMAIDQLMFAEVDIGATPTEAELAPSIAEPIAETAASPAARQGAGAARFDVRDLPPGFALASVAHDDSGEEHQVYSDGLASVSVYIAPGEGRPAVGGSTRGAMSAYSRQHERFRVYVIGDVPERTAQRIANGVVAREG